MTAAAGPTSPGPAGFDPHVTKPGDPVELISTPSSFMWRLRAQPR
jgi:hypothetical protein